MNPKQELVDVWLTKARHDLAAARILSEKSELLDTAVYHCQQAAEKAIKGLLILRDRPFEKIHDLRVLIQTHQASVPELSRWLGHGIELTPYAFRYRYPGDLLAPSRGEVDEAVRLASEIVQAIALLCASA